MSLLQAQDENKSGITSDALPQLLPTKDRESDLSTYGLVPIAKVASDAGIIIVAEAPILETLIYPPPKGTNLTDYISAISQVHGWQAASTSYGYQIKSPDLAAPVVFPKAALSSSSKEELGDQGWATISGNDFAVVRAPQGAFIPPVRLPVTLRYRVQVSQADNRKLDQLGVSVQVLADLQSSNFRALSVMTFGELLSQGAPGESISRIQAQLPFSIDKLSETLTNEWQVQIEGNDVEPVLWEERQTKNVFLESRNVDDTRVAVDREEINGGKKIEIAPVGNGFYRVTLEDLSIFGNDVTGLTSTGVVDLRNRKATWIYQGKQVQKRKGLFRRGYSTQEISYIITLEVMQFLPGEGIDPPVIDEFRLDIEDRGSRNLNPVRIKAPGRARPFVTSPMHRGLQRKP